MLGLTHGYVPRFVKPFADLKANMREATGRAWSGSLPGRDYAAPPRDVGQKPARILIDTNDRPVRSALGE